MCGHLVGDDVNYAAQFELLGDFADSDAMYEQSKDLTVTEGHRCVKCNVSYD